MMRFVRTLATALVAISMAAGSAHAQTEAAPEEVIVLAQAKKSAPRARHTGTHVYLLRGFMDVFSTGMNDLATKMNRRGIRATVHNHSEFQSLANAIGERHRQGIRENVVIIGHSLGANDAFRMAERLADFKIDVPLIIAYDPTATMSAGSNVRRVVNFYSSTNGWGVAIARGPGFRGSLSNVDLSRRGEMGHTDIDKSPALHSQSINYVQSIGGSRRATTTASPAPRKDKDEKESAAKAESKTAATEAKDAESKTADADSKKADEPKTADAESSKAAGDANAAGKDALATKDTSSETTASVGKPDKPAAESKPAAAEASVAKAAGSKPASEKPAEPKAADAKSAEKPSETKSSADKTETAASSEKKESTSN